MKPCTVGELIKILERYDPETLVYLDYAGCSVGGIEVLAEDKPAICIELSHADPEKWTP